MLAPPFGMDGLPFQLSPDPDFYFDSHGHHRVLAALRRGFSEASGFTLMSGEIGAGKTTAVRAVLRELKPEYFVVAQIVSTQLDSEELLRSISIGFGLSPAREGALALTAGLRSFLAHLRTQRRRAVLVIDEAQNLHSNALDELVGLAMRGAPGGRGMQVCLVGQPELQSMMNTADRLAVREQICVSCHLGPLEREETGPYVEHRLRKVGWKGGPTFNVGAMDEIYRWTGGIPRRINMLCSRAMVARAPGDETLIDARGVAKVARDQRNEIGETGPEPPPLPHASTRHALPVATPPRRPVLFIVASLVGHARAAALMAAMAQRVGPPPIRLVRLHDDDALALSGILFDGLDLNHSPITLGCTEAAKEARRAEVERKFKQVVDKASPKAAVVFDGGDEALGCATIARSRGIPVVRVGTSLPLESPGAAGAGGREAIEELADLCYPSGEQARDALADQGVPAACLHCAGNLLIDAVQIALRALRDPMQTGAFHRMVVPFSSDDGRYAVVLLENPKHIADRQSVVALIAFLRRISRSIALVLLMRSDAKREFDKHLLPREMFGERICHLPGQAYANQVELLRNAVCVLTDSRDCCEEATALSTPCLAIGVRAGPAGLAPGGTATIGAKARAAAWATWPCGDDGDLPAPQDGLSGARIAEHLCAWLRHPKVRPPVL